MLYLIEKIRKDTSHTHENRIKDNNEWFVGGIFPNKT